MTNQWSEGEAANKRQIERNEDLQLQVQKVQRQANVLKGKLDTANRRIKECDTQLSLSRPVYKLSWKKSNAFGAGFFGPDSPILPLLLNLTRQDVEREKAIYIAERQDISRELNRLQEYLSVRLPQRVAEVDAAGDVTDEVAESPPTTYSEDVIYNASAVNESYFYTGMSFANKVSPDSVGTVGPDKFDSFIWSGNTPGKVNDANELWKSNLTSSSKGMIQTWNPPGGRGGYISPTDSNFTTLSTSASVQRYGFQFLYNPTTIEMSYGGVQDVDPGMASSGTEEFLPVGTNIFQSTISLQIIINRMFDFQYINENGVKNGEISDFYSGNVPSNADLLDIYNKGTMYDLEYLLRTMFPFEPYDSQLRGKTADIGFLGASPVELHLGNNLRYVAQINNIGVNHVIFDNRMVPLFTTISISTNRIPDYQGSNS
jgi:hypothetical protein